MKQKKIPLRRCNGCNEMKPKKSSSEWFAARRAKFRSTLRGESPAGALMSAAAQTALKAIKSHRFEREFNCEIPQEVYDLMEKEMDESGE